MNRDAPENPPAPDLPTYLREPLERQSPERLESVTSYATNLAEWKREQQAAELERRRAEEAVDEEELEGLEEREISTDPDDYDDVPASVAYITVKTTKETGETSYEYYYWQWREGEKIRSQYKGPVNPDE